VLGVERLELDRSLAEVRGRRNLLGLRLRLLRLVGARAALACVHPPERADEDQRKEQADDSEAAPRHTPCIGTAADALKALLLAPARVLGPAGVAPTGEFAPAGLSTTLAVAGPRSRRTGGECGKRGNDRDDRRASFDLLAHLPFTLSLLAATAGPSGLTLRGNAPPCVPRSSESVQVHSNEGLGRRRCLPAPPRSGLHERRLSASPSS